MASPFTGFRTYELAFVKKASGFVTDPRTGNKVPATDTAGTKDTVRATLKPSRDPQVLRLVGADATTVVLSGRCVQPMKMPDGLRAGDVCDLTVNGVKGTFTLGPTWPSMLQSVSDALGDRIVGTWKSK